MTSQNKEIGSVMSFYEVYKTIIAEMIANIEVYEHDLPQEAVAQIAEIFREIAKYEIAKHEGNDEALQCDILEYVKENELKIVEWFRLYTICLFIRRVSKIKKIFKKYQYTGIDFQDDEKHQLRKRIDERFGTKDDIYFRDIVEQMESKTLMRVLKSLKCSYKKELKLSMKSFNVGHYVRCLVQYFRLCLKPSLKYVDICDLSLESMINGDDLGEIYEDAQLLLGAYHENYSKVIRSGIRTPLQTLFFVAIVSWIIPIMAAIPTVYHIIQWVQSLILQTGV